MRPAVELSAVYSGATAALLMGCWLIEGSVDLRLAVGPACMWMLSMVLVALRVRE